MGRWCEVGAARPIIGPGDFGAEQGLLVSWGGFKRSVLAETRRAFFEIRRWDAGDLVEAVLAHYEKFDEEIRADPPVRRVWTVVQEA